MENQYYQKGKWETIDLIEEIMSRDNLPPIQAHLIAEAQRYIGRAGKKSADWRTDIFKAMNYLHRAITDTWIDDPHYEKFQSNQELSQERAISKIKALKPIERVELPHDIRRSPDFADARFPLFTNASAQSLSGLQVQGNRPPQENLSHETRNELSSQPCSDRRLNTPLSQTL